MFKKIKTSIYGLATLGLLLSSCSKKVDELSLKASSNLVGGDLEGYMEIISDDIHLTPSSKYGKGLETKVKFKILKPYVEMGGNKGIDYIGLDLLDDGGMPTSELVQLKCDGYNTYDEVNNLKALLKKGAGEFIASFYMDTPSGLIGKDFKKILAAKEEKLKKFSITSLLTDEGVSSSSSKDSDDNSSSDKTISSGGSEDWDKVLDSYEDYVDQYIKFLKKAAEGDASAIAEYPGLMQKSKEMSDQLAEAQGNNSLSSKQVGRMAKIQTKMMQAAMEMQKK